MLVQGDAERGAGLPISSLCDRYAADVGASQLSFLQHVVRPAFEAIQPLAPSTAAAALRCIHSAQVHRTHRTHSARYSPLAARIDAFNAAFRRNALFLLIITRCCELANAA